MENKRKLQLKTLMRSEGLDYLILCPGYNLYYCTGLMMQASERHTMAFVTAESKGAIFLPSLELSYVSSILQKEFTYYSYTDEEGPDKVLKALSEDLNLDGKKIGIEFLGMRVMEYELIKKHASKASFFDAAPMISEMRMCKDEDEISYLKHAAVISEKALQKTLEMIRPGVAERDVVNELKIQMISLGSGDLWKEPLVLSGSRSASPHLKAPESDKKIEAGDVLLIDTGATYKGYTCDFSRTFAIERADDDFKKAYEVAKDAQEAVLSFRKTKLTAGELDEVARNFIKAEGYSEYYLHRVGHGIGLEGHEPPYIAVGNNMQLKEGMTFTVEPGIYIQGKWGIRIEDDVVMTNEGLQLLTSFPRKLMTLS